MIDRLLLDSPWLAVAIWALLLVSDYYLTLWGARLYRDAASRFLDTEGSYELEPQFQKDVDALRRFSPQLAWQLLVGAAVTLFAWWWTVRQVQSTDLFYVVFGTYVLLELVVHIRHRRNITLFRSLRTPDAAQGRVSYQRWVMERVSATDLSSYAAFFAILFVLTGHYLFVGGALSCLATARRHARRARRQPA